ncbi:MULTISPECIES: DUF342 domain-containing protein [Paenibacillus]|uniref:DUF342 domain-containing protein n=1 Tax=Paenibacillus TaxID=44249 RepID=UPI000435DA03|nr:MULTISPECIES: FapA family protein [Paenibacillus]KKC46740.1 polymerase [Paenibacillus sp. D9]CDN44340.1 Putative uncharacterized protein [Paenibacillus sp. P22]
MNQQLDLESYLKVSLSPDRMTGYIHFQRCDDDFSVTAQELERLVRQAGISYGILPEALQAIAGDPAACSVKETVVAKGLPARQGTDARVMFAIDLSDGFKPEENDSGKVDFKEVNRIRNVQRGQLVARKIEPGDGEAGINVAGEPVAGKRGRDMRLKVGKNVVCNPERTMVYAALDGVFTLTGSETINVFPVYEVNGDVDYRTGNIDFVGTVVIRGNVLNGFKVRAAGDIRVVGGVEGAELESDGSIEITGGIMAGNKGSIKCGKSLRCSFVQDGTVSAGEDVQVSQSIMHSQVKAGENVICLGAKGLIVGGSVQAGEAVKARTIGNGMSTATSIEVGVRPELRQELLHLRKLMKTHGEALDKTEKALALLDQLAATGQISPDKLALRIKLGATKKQTSAELDEVRDRVLEIERSLEDSSTARVEVSGTVYGGTRIVIGRYTRFIKDPASRVSFRYIDGEITMGSIV